MALDEGLKSPKSTDTPQLPADGFICARSATGYTVFAWIFTAICIGCALSGWHAGQDGAAVFFLLFTSVGVFLLLSAGSVEVNETGVIAKTGFGRYRIDWHEIQRVESDSLTLVLCGPGKHLPFAPGTLAARDRGALLGYLASRLKAKGVPTIYSRFASYRLPKNVRY